MAYEGPLPGTAAKEVKVDITINEAIVLPVQERRVLKGYDEYDDLPEDEIIHAYSLERHQEAVSTFHRDVRKCGIMV